MLASAGLTTLLLGGALLAGGLLMVWRAARHQARGRVVGIVIFVGGCALTVTGLALINFAREMPRTMALQACRARLAVVGAALREYYRDSGSFPMTLRPLVDERYISPQSLRSPFRSHIDSEDVDYIYIQGLSHDDPDSWPIVLDLEDTHADGRRTVLFLSGEARTLNEAEFRAALSTFEREFELDRGSASVFIRERNP